MRVLLAILLVFVLLVVTGGWGESLPQVCTYPREGIFTRPIIGVTKGWPKKNLTKMRCIFCLISLPTNMLEGWDIIHWKGGIIASSGVQKFQEFQGPTGP